MKVISIIGMYGAGKSSCIELLARTLIAKGTTVGVVVNDQGEVDLEQRLNGLAPVETIGGG